MTVLDFVLPAEREAHEPPEARGLARDRVRLLVAERGTGALHHHRFTELPELLRPGDVLVVNTSGTLAAAVPVPESRLTLHFSTEQADGDWLVELREAGDKATVPYSGGRAGQRYPLLGGAVVTLRQRYSRERLWIASVEPGPAGSVPAFLERFGAPIRYGYVRRPWPVSYYQTVFATHPGSAEMPSASRPFTDRVVTRLVAAGVQFAPLLLHTGVASPEAHERPYPERFAVSATTARIVNQARAAGGRIIAAGTTAVRALESATDARGSVRAAEGWTEVIITPERGVRAVDGLLTGFHEPAASHLDMLAAITDSGVLADSYAEAIRSGYLWHEFGDVNLLLP
ncbi:MAG TPA: S-adenosylmethionine:tRNA ribosyltransferase-isomerase [Pseudonocardiaceae bacterium]|jgi:S-adenosylmethionine:tRNA ribosyltransferase-isomerase|nr:S-adenosylmethionine:tRNA ribosyltransferase-isomerase [Pseudonocardiaceae bacterium]